MLLTTVFGTLEVLSANNNVEKRRSIIKKNKEFWRTTTSARIIAKNSTRIVKELRGYRNGGRNAMRLKQMNFIKKGLILGAFLLIGFYSTSIWTNSSIREEIIDRSTNEDCNDILSNESGDRRRLRREVGSSENSINERSTDHHDPPHCLEKTEPLYYVSLYHRKVCDAMVKFAFEIFYEREPNQSEFTNWFEKCISREVNEAYMTWKFTENKEHLDLLRAKRIEEDQPNEHSEDMVKKEEPNQHSGDTTRDDELVAVPMKLRIPNQQFTEDLSDPESDEFQQMSEEYSTALAEVLGDVHGLTGVKILGFGNGSLVVFYELIFDNEVKTVERVYENKDETEFLESSIAFDPVEFAKKVKNTVKDVIKETLSNSEERRGRLNNTILADADVDLDSMDTIPEDVVQELVKLNPGAPVVSVDLTTKLHHEMQTQVDVEENGPNEITTDAVQNADKNDVVVMTSPLPVITTPNFEVTESTMTEEQTLAVTTEASVNQDTTTEQSVTTTPFTSTTQESEGADELSPPDHLDSLDEENSNPPYYGFYPMNKNYDVAEPLNNVITTETTTISATTVTASDYDVSTVSNDIIVASTESSISKNTTHSATEHGIVDANPLPHTNISDLSQTVFVKLRVTNMNYTKNLTDRQSEEFQVLEAKFVQILKPLLQSIDGFADMEVVGFGYGSLIVNNEVRFIDHAPDTIKEDVKARITAAAGYFKYAHVAVDTDAVEVLRPNEADICEFVQCHLYADCVVKKGYRTECVCRPGYVSVDPDNCVSLCDLEPGYCRNGGECKVVPGRGAVCRCRVNYNWGYDGERCENLMPQSFLLVSASTGAACGIVMLLLVGSAYCYYRKRKNTRAERKAKELADKDFMRAAQIMSYHKIARDPERLRKVNPMFVQEEDESSSSKDTSSSTCPPSSTSTSSLNKSSNGSISTSSFFVREQLGNNGPLPNGMNSPEQRMLHIQTGSYPNHRVTWRGEDRKKTKSSSKMPAEEISL